MARTIPTLLNVPLNFYSGGLCKSAIRRANLLADAGHHPVILVNTVQPHLPEQRARFEDAGALDERIEIRDLLSDLREESEAAPDHLASRVHQVNKSEFRIVDSDTYPHLSTYFIGNQRHAVENRGSVTGSIFISIYDGNKRKRILQCDNTYSVRTISYLNNDEKTTLTEYLNSHGKVFLESRPGPGRNVTWRLFGRSPEPIEFENEEDLALDWLLRMNSDILSNATCITEWAYKRKTLTSLQDELNTSFLVQFHSNHLADETGRRYGSINRVLAPTFRLLENRLRGEIITLTPEQRLDIRKTYPQITNISSIPHHQETFTATETTRRNPYRITTVSRLAEGKNLHRVIPFFKRILDRVPEAEWKIFGHGDFTEEYRRQITAHGLESRITLEGFTSDPIGEYSQAAVSLFPSAFEGQSMSLYEAIGAGCVPVAFDFKYGARHAITDGENGLIVDMDNYEELVDSAALLLADQSLREEMSRRGIERLHRIVNRDDIVRRWNSLLDKYGAPEGALSERRPTDSI